MATWKAEIKVTDTGSYFPVTVEAGSSGVAKETIQHIYCPITIRNLHQVSNRSSSNSGSSEASANATVALIGLIAAAWAFMSFTPWILMGLGGTIGAWFGEKVTGQSIEEYNERDDDLGHGKVAITLLLALILGGVGFVQGDSLKKGFDVPSDTPSQVNSKK